MGPDPAGQVSSQGEEIGHRHAQREDRGQMQGGDVHLQAEDSQPPGW